MSYRNFVCLVLVSLFLQGCASSGSQSQRTYQPSQDAELNKDGSLDSGLLEPTDGHEGGRLGAQDVNSETSGELQSIDINLPVDPDLVDQVQGLDEPEEPLPMSREERILHNYETDNVGISTQLPNRENTGFRFKLNDETDGGRFPSYDR